MRRTLFASLWLVLVAASVADAQIPLPFFKKKKKQPPPAEAPAKPAESPAPGAPAQDTGKKNPQAQPAITPSAQPGTVPAPRSPEEQKALQDAINDALKADASGDTSLAAINQRISQWTAVSLMLSPQDPQYQTVATSLQAARDGYKAALDRAQQSGNASKSVQEQIRSHLDAARREIAAKNWGAAESHLAFVREHAPNHPDLPGLEEELKRTKSFDDAKRRLWVIAPLLLVLAAAAVAVWKLGAKYREDRQKRADEAAAKRQAVLQIVDGVGRGRLVTIDREKPIFKIGAAMGANEGEKNDLVISDSAATVSRFHCTVVKKDGEYYVVDASINGTRVNGDPLRRGEHYLLEDGDEITIAEASRVKFLHT